MNANAIAKHYDKLTPEERFCLGMAAHARGDDVEFARLRDSCRSITVRILDWNPLKSAFDELALRVFIELQEWVADHFQKITLIDTDELGIWDSDENGLPLHPVARHLKLPTHCLSTRSSGFILKTKADGWKLFCERLNIEPLTFWEKLPGFKRLQNTLFVVETDHYTPDEMARWCNRVRKAGVPETTVDGLISPSKVANELEETFRHLVKWAGG